MRFRHGPATLSADQRQLVAALIAQTASGALFSALVAAFDQCPEISLQVDAKDLETEEKIASILPGGLDLHERLYEWIDNSANSGTV